MRIVTRLVLGRMVYADDSQVRKVISEKFDLTSMDSIQNPSPLFATALEKYSERGRW